MIEVVGAVIVRDGRVLCAQRGPGGSMPGMWEFPGGKVEPGERPEAALVREIAEELACDVRVGDLVVCTRSGAIELTTYWCTLTAGEPVATEHVEVRWVAPGDLQALAWAEADVPAVSVVSASLRRS